MLYSTAGRAYANKIGQLPKPTTDFTRRTTSTELAIAKLKSLHIAPSKIADDATFLRRAYLDAIRDFAHGRRKWKLFSRTLRPGKRAKAVDRLLRGTSSSTTGPTNGRICCWSPAGKLNTTAMWAFYNWIRDSVKANKPWDKFVARDFPELGQHQRDGALNYFVLHKDPIELTENTTQAFLGQRIDVRALPQSPAREVDPESSITGWRICLPAWA